MIKDFFIAHGPFSVSKLAEVLQNCEIIGNSEKLIYGIASLEDATKNDISFFSGLVRYKHQLSNTKAGAILIKEVDIPIVPEGATILVVSDPHLGYGKIAEIFYTDKFLSSRSGQNISSKANIHPSAYIGGDCYIEPGVFIGEGAKIGDNCCILANTYIGDYVSIGNSNYIASNVSVMYCTIGNDCIIHSGVRIGQDGFGFASDAGKIFKIKQVGIVVIGNNVEIGANSCIDRGSITNTVIGDNTKIDNLVQIGHNVIIGDSCMLAGQSGIAGSSVIKEGVKLGGQSGIGGHVVINTGVSVAAQSGIMKDVEKDQVVAGTPAVNIRKFFKQAVFLEKAIKSLKEDGDED